MFTSRPCGLPRPGLVVVLLGKESRTRVLSSKSPWGTGICGCPSIRGQLKPQEQGVWILWPINDLNESLVLNLAENQHTLRMLDKWDGTAALRQNGISQPIDYSHRTMCIVCVAFQSEAVTFWLLVTQAAGISVGDWKTLGCSELPGPIFLAPLDSTHGTPQFLAARNHFLGQFMGSKLRKLHEKYLKRTVQQVMFPGNKSRVSFDLSRAVSQDEED